MKTLINNSPKQNCLNFFKYKLEINGKKQTFVQKLLFVSFGLSLKLVTIFKTNNLPIISLENAHEFNVERNYLSKMKILCLQFCF